MKKWKIVIPALAIVLFLLWYAFRPDRLFINRSVDESFPAAKGDSPAQTLESGTFHSLLHPTSGTATVYVLGDGSHLLRFTNFRTSNGPDVHVYMVATDSANDNESVKRAGFIDLGELKGNIGDQNYVLRPEVDLAKYRAVSVWCKRFSVNFGSASLTPDHASAQN